METRLPTGVYASSWYSGDTFKLLFQQLNPDVESSGWESGALSQCAVPFNDILSYPK